MKRNLRLSLCIAAVLIVCGVGFLVVYRDRLAMPITPLPTAAQVAQARRGALRAQADNAVISGEPVALSIPSLDVQLQIIPGVYNYQTQEWTLTSDKAQYAVVTPQPNNKGGNTFIYGHYRRGVFYTLHQISPGSEAIITTANGKKFTYVLDNVRVVNPDESDAVLNYQGKPILTIQTCTGIFYQYRQLFTFNFVKVA